MTVPAIQQPPEADQAFAQDAYLTYTIPLATNFDIKDAVKTRKVSVQKFFESIPDRDWLFFGSCSPSQPPHLPDNAPMMAQSVLVSQ